MAVAKYLKQIGGVFEVGGNEDDLTLGSLNLTTAGGSSGALTFQDGSVQTTAAPRSVVTLATHEITALTMPTSAGIYSFDPADYGPAQTFYFDVVANMDGVASEGRVELFNVTTSSVEAFLTFTESGPTPKSSAALPLLAGLYEIRFFVTSGEASLLLSWAGLRIEPA